MSNVPELIRATAIETLAGSEHETAPNSGQYLRIGTRLAGQVVDAILPAVVAQIQADTGANLAKAEAVIERALAVQDGYHPESLGMDEEEIRSILSEYREGVKNA